MITRRITKPIFALQPATIENYVKSVCVNVKSLENHRFQDNSLEHQ